MITDTISFRVRYNEVDRMGYVHHGNYAAYFEMGRTELMRKHGLNYKEMEDNGVILPLSEFYVKYYSPALYDDNLSLETILTSYSGVRLNFEYILKNQHGDLIAEGKTPLVFVNNTSRKPMRPPKELIEKISSYF
ncbi:MAG: acyl-CoA thioesterase [Bacteroidales bacterium]|nr:acyl-CoA thioesterase [Bacteroidales bacterium]MBN2817857.1 acyl-CoA thioesterase [Bacteroidales bacterium]